MPNFDVDYTPNYALDKGKYPPAIFHYTVCII